MSVTVRPTQASRARASSVLLHARPGLVASLAILVLALGLSWLTADQEASLRFISPAPGSFVLGEVQIEVRIDTISSEPLVLDELQLFVDGRLVGTLVEPPYQLTVDLGADSNGHRFEAVAITESGQRLLAQVDTEPVPIGGEVTVQLQQLYTRVTDDGRTVSDLSPEEVTVYDEGVRQRIISFSQGDVPFTAALLIDASESMQGTKLEAACAGAKAFIRGMGRLDQARVMVFSDRLLASSPLTNDSTVLSTELARVQAQGGTALNDHLFAALKLLEQQQGRRVVIILSDGIDTHSALTMEQVLETARRSQALVYWIRLNRRFGSTSRDDGAPSLTSTWRSSKEYRRQWDQLFEAVESSGGFVTRVDSTDQITPVFEMILRDLRDQYAIGYYPSTVRDDGRWHPVRVKIHRFGLEVRTQKGYVDL